MTPAEQALLKIMQADTPYEENRRETQELGARNHEKPKPNCVYRRTRGPELTARVEAVLRCHRAGMRPYEIRRALNLTPGQVSGILDRYLPKQTNDK